MGGQSLKTILLLCFCYFYFAESKLQVDIHHGKNLGFNFKYPIEDVISALFRYNSVCIWTNSINHHVNIHEIILEKLSNLEFSSLYLDFLKITSVKNICHQNIVLFSDISSKIAFISDRTLSLQYSFLVLDVNNSISNLDGIHNDTFIAFGLANTVVINEFLMLKLSSTHFFPRKLEFTSNLSGLINVEPILDMKGRNVKVATINSSIFSINRGPLNSGFHDGIEVRIMKELAKRLNFTYTFVKIKGDDLWGKKMPNGSWSGGLTGSLVNGEAEIAFGSMWTTERVVDYGPSWTNMPEYKSWAYMIVMSVMMIEVWPLNVYYTYIVPRSHVINGVWIMIVRLFDKTVWTLLLGLHILMSLLLWKKNINVTSSLVETSLTIFGMFLSKTSFLRIRKDSWRYYIYQLITSWSIFSYFITELFNNTALSSLLVPHYSAPIDNIEDIVKGNYYWGEPGYNAERKNVLLFKLEDQWHRKMLNQYRFLDGNTTRGALHSKRFVFPVQRLEQDYIIMHIDGLESEDLSKYRVMKQTLNFFSLGIGFSRHSPLEVISHRHLQFFLETGLVKHWKKDVVLHYGKNNVKRLLCHEYREGIQIPKPLSRHNIRVAFNIILFGSAISIWVFIIELLFKYCKCRKKIY